MQRGDARVSNLSQHTILIYNNNNNTIIKTVCGHIMSELIEMDFN